MISVAIVLLIGVGVGVFLNKNRYIVVEVRDKVVKLFRGRR